MCSIGWFTLIIYIVPTSISRARRFAARFSFKFKVSSFKFQVSSFKFFLRFATKASQRAERQVSRWRVKEKKRHRPKCYNGTVASPMADFFDLWVWVQNSPHGVFLFRGADTVGWFGGEACPLRFMSGRTAPRLWSPSMLTSVGRGELSNYTSGCKGSKFVCKSQVFRELSAF